MRGEKTDRAIKPQGDKDFEQYADGGRMQEEIEERNKEVSKTRNQIAITVLAYT